MLTVTVVTPSRNQGQFLASAIESVAGQATANLEHVVVDGASTDDSLSILQAVGDRVQWLSEPDRGYAHAVNKALDRSSGDVVGWLNADDVYYASAIERVRTFFDANPAVDVVYGKTDMIDEDGDVVATCPVKKWSENRLKRRSCLYLPSVFFRRRVLADHGPLDEDLIYQPDYAFWLRLASRGAVFAHLPVRLGGCRIHPGNRYVWTANLPQRIEATEETLSVLTRLFGPAPSARLLEFGRLRAEQDGFATASTIRYDLSVLKHAARRADGDGKRFATRITKRIRILGRHVARELKETIRRPRLAARLLPPPINWLARGHFRRKIFKLHHHSPRPIKLPAGYSKTPLRAERPVISIVTPSFNQGCFLEQTISSVLSQNYPRLEYIIQDGGSSDNSVDIIRRHEAQLKHWESAPDGGQTPAINAGMRRTTGDILAYLNSDDLLLPGALNHVAEFFQQNPEVDVVYGHRLLINEHGETIGRWVLPSHDDRVLPWVDYIPQETMFWRRSAWERVNSCLDASFRFAMDWDLILRFRQAGCRFQRLPRFLGAFRVCDEQKTCQLINTVGLLEMKRLRRRHLGHIPSHREIRRSMRPYMRRHWFLDKLYTVGLAKY